MMNLNFPNAIFDESDFYGRQDELSAICQTLINKQRVPIFVVGERRIGKTSLQNIAIKQVISNEQYRLNGYHIEPRGIASYSQFAIAILRQLTTGVNAASAATLSLPQVITTIEEFEEALRNILERLERDVIICVDEFDVIIHTLHEDRSTLIGMLYHLIEKTRLPIYFFFTVTSIPQEMEDEYSSTLTSVSQIIELKPLKLEEVCTLTRNVTQDRFAWPDAALDRLFVLSGGHPYITKLILSCLPLERPSGGLPVTVTDELLNRAIQTAINNSQANHVLVNLFTTHFSADEKNLMLFLVQHGGPVSTSLLEKAGKSWVAHARRLKKRNYLKSDTPETQFDFQIAFLGLWLKNWSEFDLQCDEFGRLNKLLSQPEIEVDENVGLVSVKGQSVKLSAQEYKIMRSMAAKVDHLVTRDDLMEAAWDTANGVSDQTIDAAVCRLRSKLKDQGHYIETVKGRGFILHRAVLLNSTTDNQIFT